MLPCSQDHSNRIAACSLNVHKRIQPSISERLQHNMSLMMESQKMTEVGSSALYLILLLRMQTAQGNYTGFTTG